MGRARCSETRGLWSADSGCGLTPQPQPRGQAETAPRRLHSIPLLCRQSPEASSCRRCSRVPVDGCQRRCARLEGAVLTCLLVLLCLLLRLLLLLLLFPAQASEVLQVDDSGSGVAVELDPLKRRDPWAKRAADPGAVHRSEGRSASSESDSSLHLEYLVWSVPLACFRGVFRCSLRLFAEFWAGVVGEVLVVLTGTELVSEVRGRGRQARSRLSGPSLRPTT